MNWRTFALTGLMVTALAAQSAIIWKQHTHIEDLTDVVDEDRRIIEAYDCGTPVPGHWGPICNQGGRR